MLILRVIDKMTTKLDKKDKDIQRLIKAARKAMKQLEWAMPVTEEWEAYDALRKAIKAAEKSRASS